MAWNKPVDDIITLSLPGSSRQPMVQHILEGHLTLKNGSPEQVRGPPYPEERDDRLRHLAAGEADEEAFGNAAQLVTRLEEG